MPLDLCKNDREDLNLNQQFVLVIRILKVCRSRNLMNHQVATGFTHHTAVVDILLIL